jgi:hypothetical protein
MPDLDPWFYLRDFVELILMFKLYEAFSVCHTAREVLNSFYGFDTLKQLGTALAVFVIGAGFVEIVGGLGRLVFILSPSIRALTRP